MKEELRQTLQTGTKDKHGNNVNDSHPSLSAERGSSRPSSSPGSRPPRRLGSGGRRRALGEYRFGKHPHVLVSLFFPFCI